MSYTSGNSAPTLMAQMPNRVGNKSKHLPSKQGGATNVTNPKGSTMYGSATQGAPSANGSITGIHQKVMLSKPKGYCGTIENDGYLKNSSFLK
tara:strand:- start:52 stop:330 length:279 start_codon:yes stop_codon:yes gene_type:complete